MSKKAIYAEDLLAAIRDDPSIKGKDFARIRQHIKEAPAVVNEELQFTRQFIHEHGLDFAFASAWNGRAEYGK